MTVKLERNIAVYCREHGFTVGTVWTPKGYQCECRCTVPERASVQLHANDLEAINKAIVQIKADRSKEIEQTIKTS